VLGEAKRFGRFSRLHANFSSNQTNERKVMATFNGSNGDDVLPPVGSDTSGEDDFFGFDGNDKAHGGLSNDSFDMGGGNDEAWGDDGDDYLSGGADNDTLWGGAGTDTLDGGGGNDKLDGGTGADIMIGNFGDDTYYVDNVGDTLTEYQAADGYDRVYSSVTFTLSAYLDDMWLTGSSAINGTGNASNNVINGNTAANTLSGSGGDDILYGRDGNDTLNGGDGNDKLIGGAGADKLIGGTGTDRAYYNDSTVGLTVDLATAANNTGIAAGDTFSSIEDLYGSNYNDSLRGNGVANTIWGNGGNDTIYGRDGDDTLNGGDGSDTLLGGVGADALAGGNGIDRAQYSDATAGLTVDLATAANNTGIAAGDTFSSIENLYGSNYNDSLRGDAAANTIWGSAGNDSIYGRDGNDTLNGGDGNDYLLGGAGADALIGGNGIDRAQYSDATSGVAVDLTSPASNIGFAAGDTFSSIEDLYGSNYDDSLFGDDNANRIWGSNGSDTIYGGGGNDILYGGLGNDDFRGGAGNDAFVFDSALANNVDQIIDFEIAADTIRLASAIFSSIVGTGTLTANQFAANSSGAAVDSDDRIIFETDSGKLFYDSNGSAAGGVTQIANVYSESGIPTLTASNFTVF
jgi:Ca2+-binding RTX toxin-like protein